MNTYGRSEDVFHHPLEGHARIPQTKRHLKKFKQAERGNDGRLLHIGGGNCAWR
jgi:hypothetical protein